MDNRYWFRVMSVLLVAAALVGFGFYSYNMGVARGVAEAGQIAAPSGGTPVFVMWPRPWGFGFGFFPFFPLIFFVLFWLFASRVLFWRGGWRGRGCGNRSTEALDEWHRRAHGQQGVDASPRVNA